MITPLKPNYHPKNALKSIIARLYGHVVNKNTNKDTQKIELHKSIYLEQMKFYIF